MSEYFRCLHSGHVFSRYAAKVHLGPDRITYVITCPVCESSEVMVVPDAVVDAIRKKFDDAPQQTCSECKQVIRRPVAVDILRKLQYDRSNGCYFFHYAGMYHGVEEDGYVHT